MTHLLERTLAQLSIENEEENPNNYASSTESSGDGYESEDEIVFGRNDSYYLDLIGDNDSYMSDSESQSITDDDSSAMLVDDRIVLHPVHSRYAQHFPRYNVFCGQPLVNNGYINVDQAMDAEAARPSPFLRT